MYIISIITVIIVSVLMMLFTDWGISSVIWFIDPVSLLLILLITIPIMLSAGLLKDLNNACRIAIKKNVEITYRELKRGIEAVCLLRRTLIAAGAFTALFSLVMVLMGCEEQALLAPNCAVAITGFVYAMGFVIILLPLESRLKIKLQDMMHE